MTKSTGTVLTMAGALALTVLVLGCSRDESPTAPPNSLVLSGAAIMVDGEVVNGMTLPRGHGEGGIVFFRAVLTERGLEGVGHSVMVRYERPSESGMGWEGGSFACFDDGTHGDMVAFDGVYSLEDTMGEYGCGTSESMPGEYHYDFYGVDHSGNESNHMEIHMTVLD